MSRRHEASVAMDPERFRALGHERVDRISDFLSSLPDRPVTPGESPEVVRSVPGADAPLPEEGSDPGEIQRSTADLLIDHSLFNGHPRFFGYITSSATPISALFPFLPLLRAA